MCLAASNAQQPISIVYVPSHLYHMLFELFKVRLQPGEGGGGRGGAGGCLGWGEGAAEVYRGRMGHWGCLGGREGVQ